MSLGNWLWPSSLRQFFWAASTSLNTIASAVLFERQPLARIVRCRTVAKAPILRAFAHAVGEAEQFLPALRCRADDDQDALLGVFKTGLQVNAVGPHVDVALGRQIALAPVFMLVAPALLQPRDGRGRQARRILAEQGGKRLLEIAGREAFQV